MRRLKLLDLYCCEGGASTGFAQAGFEVTGVDISYMPKYPFKFIKASALALPLGFLKQFDAIAASPPCKVHTVMRAFSSDHHSDLVPQTRELLKLTGLPWVIENVPGAPLLDPVTLCGSMFDLMVRRHRLFESNFPIKQPQCDHEYQEFNSPGFRTKQYHSGKPVEHTANVVSVYGRGNGYGPGETQLWRKVMGMPWASKDGMSQAIPPAYTKYIGEELISHIRADYTRRGEEFDFDLSPYVYNGTPE